MGPLVGRTAELAKLESVLSSVGRPVDVMIRGEAGIGKTSLWQAACSLVEREGRGVLVARPTEAESTLPYAVVMDLLRLVVNEELLGKLPEPQQIAVEVALLRRPIGAGSVSDLAVAAGVLRIVAELARGSPVVIALDDAQWIDPASTRILTFVLRRVRDLDVTVLSTVRSPHNSPLGHDYGGPRVEVVLRGLDLDGLDELVTSHLDRRLSLPALVRLGRLSAGNPLAALELVRAADQRQVDLGADSDIAVPHELGGLLSDRLDALSGPARRLLLLVAAAAAPDIGLLTAAVPDVDVVGLLGEAERAQVISLDGGVARFAHPLMSEVATDAAAFEECRAAHARLAAVVSDEVDRARHLAASATGADEALAAAVANGACSALARGAPAPAAVLFEQSLRLTPAWCVPALSHRTVDTVRAWIAAGAPQRAVMAARRSIELLPPSPARGQVLAALAQALGLAEGLQEALPLLEQAAAEVAGDDAATARVLRRLAWEQAVAGDLRAGRRTVMAALAAAERHSDQEELAATLAAVAMLRFLGGDADAIPTLERAINTLPSHGTSSARRDLERDRTMMASWGDEPDAGVLVATRRREALARGDAEGVQYWDWFETLIRLRSGSWGSVQEHVAQIERDGQRLGLGGQMSSDLWLRALIEAHLGKVDDARRHAEAGIQAARDEQTGAIELWCEGVVGFLDLSLGSYELAAERLWVVHGRCEQAGLGEPGHLRHLADAVEALVVAGRRKEASQVADRLRELGEQTGNRWAGAASVRCDGLVSEATGQRAEAVAVLVHAVELHERLGQPFELARTMLVLGAALRRAKQKAAARKTLERSLQMFEGLPAPLWRDRARSELARLGAPVTGRWELTPTERRIAELVARGRTNREVADELFLSHKTVEWNLSKVYRKVGIRSRSELASCWDRDLQGVESGDTPGS